MSDTQDVKKKNLNYKSILKLSKSILLFSQFYCIIKLPLTLGMDHGTETRL